MRALHGFDDLFDPQVIARAVDAYIAGAEADDALLDAEETSTGASQLARLATLAERNGMSVAVRRAILVAQLREEIDNRQDSEMSATRASSCACSRPTRPSRALSSPRPGP